MKATHSDRLERWLGPEAVGRVSHAMRDFYWPIAMHGVPGTVYAMPGGDFTGEIRAGSELSAVEAAQARLKVIERQRFARAGMSRKQLGAFANLSTLIAAATGGKAQNLFYRKTGVASNAIANSNDMWVSTGTPGAGAAGAAAPGGTSPTNSTTGAIGFANPTNANTAHFVNGLASASVINMTALLYDRLFSVAKTMNSTATEAVTGTFSRYQSQTATDEDYIGGNFCFPSNPTTVLAATGHNWTVCQYTDQGGNTAQSFGTGTGVSACVVQGVDLSVGNWFMPLASGDVGVKALTQMQCSALVATGTIDFVVGHPIAFMPCPVANLYCALDGINTAFNLTRIYDNACLAVLDLLKAATTATNWNIQLQVVAE